MFSLKIALKNSCAYILYAHALTKSTILQHSKNIYQHNQLIRGSSLYTEKKSEKADCKKHKLLKIKETKTNKM